MVRISYVGEPKVSVKDLIEKMREELKTEEIEKEYKTLLEKKEKKKPIKKKKKVKK